MPIRKPKMKLSQDEVFQKKLDTSFHLATILAHPLRLSLIEFIDQFPALDENRLNMVFQGDQSILHTHLDLLISANFILVEHRDNQAILTLNYERIDRINKLLETFQKNPKQLMVFQSARQNKPLVSKKIKNFMDWTHSFRKVKSN